MTLKNPTVLIGKTDPFEHCQLGRKTYATVLTQVVRKYAEGFVLALNNPWGTGKTTFVRMWAAQLQAEGCNTPTLRASKIDQADLNQTKLDFMQRVHVRRDCLTSAGLLVVGLIVKSIVDAVN